MATILLFVGLLNATSVSTFFSKTLTGSVTVAQQTLALLVKVQILARQPYFSYGKIWRPEQIQKFQRIFESRLWGTAKRRASQKFDVQNTSTLALSSIYSIINSLWNIFIYRFAIKDLRGWRNWQTRMFEGHIAHAVWVQVPPRAPNLAKQDLILSK